MWRIIVGLFPIVATNARIAQNAQLAGAYSAMLRNIETFSPVQLFTDAGFTMDKGFRKMISEYGVMKGVLYNNVAKYADALNGEAFGLGQAGIGSLGAVGGQRQAFDQGQADELLRVTTARQQEPASIFWNYCKRLFNRSVRVSK